MKAYLPMSWPQTMVALAPIVAPLPTWVRAYSDLRLITLRGLMTFVNTMEGPRNTSSSQITPVYIDTLFCTLTLLPSTTCGDTTTFWPILQFSPIVQPGIICEKCQIFVPFPIAHP